MAEHAEPIRPRSVDIIQPEAPRVRGGRKLVPNRPGLGLRTATWTAEQATFGKRP